VRPGGPGDPRLALLAGDEFAPVRAALGLPPEWDSEHDLPRDGLRRQVTEVLRPRERQALGLKYLGYSDKQMAQLMGVKKGVPRSYFSEGTRKLGLSAGASLMLFVHFAGLVEHDALPLLALSAAEERPAPSDASPGLDTKGPLAPASAERPA
jgi:DNA-binding CsgD family transcriptional regulator